MINIYHNLKIRNAFFKKKKNCISFSTSTNYVNHAESGQENFETNYERLHLETTPFQKFLLGLGSGMVSLADPSRGDMVAVMGESTGTCSLKHIYGEMSKSEEGRAILKEKPRINSYTVDLYKLKSMQEGTLGKAYSNFLEKYNYSPDTRMAVRFVDDIELAYVIQRYREVHDLFHSMFNMPTNMLGEVTVKWVEAIQTRLPMCVTGALFGSLRLAPKFTRMYSTKISVTPLEEAENKDHNYRTKIPSVELPKNVQETIKLLFEHVDIVKLRSEVPRYFSYIECKRPPLEEHELVAKKDAIERKILDKYDTNREMSPAELEKFNAKIDKKVMNLCRSECYQWKSVQYDKNLSYLYLASRAPFEYAVLRRVFNEIHSRDKHFKPRNIFDFGSGVGTVNWVAYDFWGNSINEYFTVDSSSAMNDLALSIVHGGNIDKKPLFKTLYQREFLPMTPEKYDLVVSSFSFMEIGNLEARLKTFLTLWNKVKHYLVIVENGTNAGFKLINEFREFLMHLSSDSKTKFHFFSPCPHDYPCPRYYEDMIKKTPCNFTVKYQQLKILSQTGKGEDYADGKYCYLVVKKGGRPLNDAQWPRIVRESQKRHRHIYCHFCTAQGELKKVVITQSKQGKEIYQCAKSLRWGDLFPGSISITSSQPSDEGPEETESPALENEELDNLPQEEKLKNSEESEK